jgi:hypothetical protein
LIIIYKAKGLPMNEDWIPTSEATNISGYNAEHLRRLMRSGVIKARKFGSVWQVSKKSLKQYLNLVEIKKDKRWGPRSG